MNSNSVIWETKTDPFGNVSCSIVGFPEPLKPNRVIFNDPVTVVIWNDGTKTRSTCDSNDVFSEDVGFAMCLAKKMFGKKSYMRIIKRAQRQKNEDKNR